MPGMIPDFGVISSSTKDVQDVESFLNGDDIEPITQTPAKPAQVQKKTTKPLPKEGEEEQTDEEEQVPVNQPISADQFFDDGEEEEDKEENTEEQNQGPKVEKEDTSVYASFATDLFEVGILRKDDDEDDIQINTPEDLRDRLEFEKKRDAGEIIDKFLDSKGEGAREIFQAIFVDGIDPVKYLQSHVKIQNILEMDITNEDNQRALVTEMYKQQGRKDVATKVQRLVDQGDLEEEAKEAQEILAQQEAVNIESEAEQKKAESARKAQAKTQYINSVNTILSEKLKAKEFDGIPVTKGFAEQINGYLTKEKYQTKAGEFLTEFDKDMLDLNKPDNYELKVKMAMLRQMLKEDPKLTKIQKVGVSKESSELFKSVRQQQTPKPITNQPAAKPILGFLNKK